MALEATSQRKSPPAFGRTPEEQARARAVFCEIAADMEMGYYVDPDGHQWDARPFVITQTLRTMGFADSTVDERHYPVWWPGQETMRRMVALKVMLRQAQSRVGAGGHPWLDPLLATTVEELLTRLYAEPKSVGMRELVELVVKLARLQNDQRRTGTLSAPGAAVHSEGVAIQRVTETIISLPPEEQERARRALDAVTARMREALPEPVE